MCKCCAVFIDCLLVVGAGRTVMDGTVQGLGGVVQVKGLSVRLMLLLGLWLLF